MTDIIDFGDNCLPHILIRDILFLKQKSPNLKTIYLAIKEKSLSIFHSMIA